MGERAARRARALLHLRPRHLDRRGARHPEASRAGLVDRAAGTAMALSGARGASARDDGARGSPSARARRCSASRLTFADRLGAHATSCRARFAALPPARRRARTSSPISTRVSPPASTRGARARRADIARRTATGGAAAARALARARASSPSSPRASRTDSTSTASPPGCAPLEVDAPSVFHTGQRVRHQLRSRHDREPVVAAIASRSGTLTEALLAAAAGTAGA